ncbi:MAG TPA: glycosyltransferase family 2 protein, partial [Chroococcales cyanobacterium]
VLMLTVASVDSAPARSLKRRWTHWRLPNRYYFGRRQLQLLLERTGFGDIWMTADARLFPLAHVLENVADINWFSALPTAIRNRRVRLNSSGLIVTCAPRPALSESGEPTRLSIIMPVYNEHQTIESTLQAVLAKTIAGVDEKEIVLVESCSTDGTRELIAKYEDRPELKIIYEERPRGKGHAVRTGLAHASGQIVMIQDADSEYDINDYDELLKPLTNYEELFVLGSRHNGGFKMRTFTDRPLLSLFFNFGQVLFTTLMNTLYGQCMTDPFTMYKVMRRECLYGLKFECNRFDFDHELVIKLLLKGYKPREIPVNYTSRSYEQGKKVTIILDPLLWIKANFKFRFSSPYIKAVEERHRLALTNRVFSARPHRESAAGSPYSPATAVEHLATTAKK